MAENEKSKLTHNCSIALRPICEIAAFLKNLIPADIPNNYALNPKLKNIAGKENIRNGVIAFRDFLYTLLDRIISDGHLYAKQPKTPSNIDDYPFLYHLANLLVDIGYYGNLSESGNSLLVSSIKAKIPAACQMDCLRFLTLCNLTFSGVDLGAKNLNISETQMMEVSYPRNPIMLTGLKAMAFAEMELRTTRKFANDKNILRCDYHLLKAENSDIGDILQDFLHSLPEAVQNFVLKLHKRHTDLGMTCALRILDDFHFAYADTRKSRRGLDTQGIYSKRLWGVSISLKHGYCLVVRAKKIEKYADIIKTFSPALQEKIAKGYGCDRKRGERCQGSCIGIRIPLDENIPAMNNDIETWLEQEVGILLHL